MVKTRLHTRLEFYKFAHAHICWRPVCLPAWNFISSRLRRYGEDPSADLPQRAAAHPLQHHLSARGWTRLLERPRSNVRQAVLALFIVLTCSRYWCRYFFFSLVISLHFLCHLWPFFTPFNSVAEPVPFLVILVPAPKLRRRNNVGIVESFCTTYSIIVAMLTPLVWMSPPSEDSARCRPLLLLSQLPAVPGLWVANPNLPGVHATRWNVVFLSLKEAVSLDFLSFVYFMNRSHRGPW